MDTNTTRYFIHPADLEELTAGLQKVRDSLSLLASVMPTDGDMWGAADVLAIVDSQLGEAGVMLEDDDSSKGLILTEPTREHLCDRLEQLVRVLAFLSARMDYGFPRVSPVGLGETLELVGDKLSSIASMLWPVKLEEFHVGLQVVDGQ